jgi:hypothetical protein
MAPVADHRIVPSTSAFTAIGTDSDCLPNRAHHVGRRNRSCHDFSTQGFAQADSRLHRSGIDSAQRPRADAARTGQRIGSVNGGPGRRFHKGNNPHREASGDGLKRSWERKPLGLKDFPIACTRASLLQIATVAGPF